MPDWNHKRMERKLDNMQEQRDIALDAVKKMTHILSRRDYEPSQRQSVIAIGERAIAEIDAARIRQIEGKL